MLRHKFNKKLIQFLHNNIDCVIIESTCVFELINKKVINDNKKIIRFDFYAAIISAILTYIVIKFL